ncbi:hypothetical protein [Natronolimnobius baerhuensis]|uniref:hypothetical protein n=1 Tax=Natronolimnobius baerhuensis TaxID=253108 RepID=UPI0011250F96|nr:hypothetical protein [Natronolimnobius baerhuensis]
MVDSYSDEWTSEQKEQEEESHELQEQEVVKHQVYTDVKRDRGNTRWTVEYVERERFVAVSKSCSCGGYGYYSGHEDENMCAHRYRLEYLKLAQHRGLLQSDRFPNFGSDYDVMLYS